MNRYSRLEKDTFWYRYIYPKNLTLFDQIKIVAPEISLGGNFTIDSDGRYYSTTKVYGYVKKKDLPVSYPFLLGILNSALFWFFIQKTGYVLRGGYYTFKTSYVTPFPFPDFETLSMDIVSKIEVLVEEIMEKKPTGRDTAHIQREIDQLVCRLYGIDMNAMISASSR